MYWLGFELKSISDKIEINANWIIRYLMSIVLLIEQLTLDQNQIIS